MARPHPARARAAGLLAGLALDAIVADPPAAHPVAAFGRLAARLEEIGYADRRAAGAAHVTVLVGAAALAGAAVQRTGRHRRWLAVLATTAATWTALGACSLARRATAMAGALEAGDLDTARAALPGLCGRDPDRLDAPGLVRASIESVAENTSDAAVAPLFWAALGGVPGVLAYRAANTLDAMIGYRSPRYRRFGWAAARLDDMANLLPARLSVALTALCAPVVGGPVRLGWQRGAAAHPSPNAGRVEAAFAGALGVGLGGRTPYAHGVEQRPVLGPGRAPLPGDLRRAVRLSRAVTTLAGALAVVGTVIAG